MKLAIYQSPLVHVEGSEPTIIKLTFSKHELENDDQFRSAELESPIYDSFLLAYLQEIVTEVKVPENLPFMVAVHRQTLEKTRLFEKWLKLLCTVLDEIPNPVIVAFDSCTPISLLIKRRMRLTSLESKRLQYCLNITEDCGTATAHMKKFNWSYVVARANLLGAGASDVSEALFIAKERNVKRIVTWIHSKVSLTIAGQHFAQYVHGSIFSKPFYLIKVVETVKGIDNG